jgi:hypothetical protein
MDKKVVSKPNHLLSNVLYNIWTNNIRLLWSALNEQKSGQQAESSFSKYAYGKTTLDL